METKTYFASSVQAAMEVARKELGPDAMLVNSGPAPEAARRFGRLEVTFAWAAGGMESGEATHTAPAPLHGGPRPAGLGIRTAEAGPRRGDSGLEGIRLEMSELRAAIGRQGMRDRPGASGDRPDISQIAPETDSAVDAAVGSLCETGMEREMARQLAVAAARDTGKAGNGMLRELTARLPASTFTPLEADEGRTLALVGPPGRGKSSSLVKIAVRYGLAARIPVRIYTAGAHGVGAVEQMARYASILGVPFQAIESFESLHLALEGDRWKGLVLIDTPGSVSGDRQEMDGMAKFFARQPRIERHLVIRAEARSADMQNMLSRFTAIQPSRLLFTGIDEVRGLGAAAETMIRSGIPATFFGTGARIPDDIEEVSLAKLARSLWTANGLAARAA